MALKNLFDMVKADRYTADGREELIKAQEAETEDVKYQNGDISQKTGLMKTPNGWVEPPKGKPEKGSKEDVKQRLGAYVKAMNKYNGEFAGRSKKMGESSKQRAQEQLAELNRANTESNPLQHTSASAKFQESVYKDIKNNGLEDYTVEEIAKEYGTTRGDAEAIRARLNKDKLLDSLSFDLVDTTSDIEEEYNAVEHSDNSRLPEFVRKQVENEYVNKTNGEKWSDAEKDIIAEEVTRRIKERQSNDAAPRVLTGDTKIRVRKA